MTALNELVGLDPSLWEYNEEVEIRPDDFTQVMNNGFDCDSKFPDPKTNDPRRWMPWDESAGGAFCFDSRPYMGEKHAFITLMESLDISNKVKTFTVFIEEGSGLQKQMRIVSARALKSVFKVLNQKEYDSFPEQEVTMAEAFWLFFLDATPNHNTPPKIHSEKSGSMATLIMIPPSIGIMVENSYYGIYRIWSRWPTIRK